MSSGIARALSDIVSQRISMTEEMYIGIALYHWQMTLVHESTDKETVDPAVLLRFGVEREKSSLVVQCVAVPAEQR
jgi:hypothetical protein